MPQQLVTIVTRNLGIGRGMGSRVTGQHLKKSVVQRGYTSSGRGI
uniref:Uncharacterized protein n=1 Tax=Arundo donax TaxID=35708 RepID=A0A0A9AEE0_ARUDO